MNQSLQQKLLQKLSPQQIQLMKLLQVPTAILDERIKEEMEENPALEQGEDGHEDEYETDEFERLQRKSLREMVVKKITTISISPTTYRMAMMTLVTTD